MKKIIVLLTMLTTLMTSCESTNTSSNSKTFITYFGNVMYECSGATENSYGSNELFDCQSLDGTRIDSLRNVPYRRVDL